MRPDQDDVASMLCISLYGICTSLRTVAGLDIPNAHPETFPGARRRSETGPAASSTTHRPKTSCDICLHDTLMMLCRGLIYTRNLSSRFHSNLNHRVFLSSISPSFRISPACYRQKIATMSTSSDAIVHSLQKYTSCDVSDALVKLKHPRGGFLPGITLFSPERQSGDTKIVGRAYTVKYVPNDDPTPKHPSHYVSTHALLAPISAIVLTGVQIDSIPAGAVVFVSCPPGVSNAVYGGLMSARAKASGAVGTVIDGRFRDLQEQRALGYPVRPSSPPFPYLQHATELGESRY